MARKKLELICGTATIVMENNNIKIEATGDISIEAKGQLNLNGANVNHYGNIVVHETISVYYSVVYMGSGTRPPSKPSFGSASLNSLAGFALTSLAGKMTGQSWKEALGNGVMGGLFASNGIASYGMQEGFSVLEGGTAADPKTGFQLSSTITLTNAGIANAISGAAGKVGQGGITAVSTGKSVIGGMKTAFAGDLVAMGTTALAPSQQAGDSGGKSKGSTSATLRFPRFFAFQESWVIRSHPWSAEP